MIWHNDGFCDSWLINPRILKDKNGVYECLDSELSVAFGSAYPAIIMVTASRRLAGGAFACVSIS